VNRELAMSRLTTELTDFLDLPAHLDLPPVRSIECKRTHDTGWTVEAWVGGDSDAVRYEAMLAWARLAGGTVEFSKPYPAGHQPSGIQRTLTVRIVIAQVPIKLVAGVDGLFAVPQAAEAVAL
jgi:hypothetical protein